MVEYHCYIMCCYITTYDTRFSTIYTAVPNNLYDSQTNSVVHLVTILTKSIALSKFLYIFYSQISSDLTIEYLCNRNTAGLESLLTLLYRVYRPDVLRIARDALLIPFQNQHLLTSWILSLSVRPNINAQCSINILRVHLIRFARLHIYSTRNFSQ